MPSFQYIDETGVVVIVREGALSLSDDLALIQQRKDRPDLRGRPTIIDLRRLDSPDQPPNVKRIASEVEYMPRGTIPNRLAVVVSKPVAYGMARVFLALTDGRYSEGEVFYDWDAAASWLTGGATIADPADQADRGVDARPDRAGGQSA